MKVSLIEATPFAEQLCGAAAAVCTDSDNYERSLKHALESGHTSVLEHAVFTFKVEGLSRAALAQLTRHRLASFDVQSQRYVRLDDWNMVIPESIAGSRYAAEAESAMRYMMNLYQRMVEDGIAEYANPASLCRAAVMMLRHMGAADKADTLEAAINGTAADLFMPGDGRGNTAFDFTDYVLAHI